LNAGTSGIFAIAKDAETVNSATELLRVTEAPLLLLNETANADMTIGLTINQSTNDDHILALKSTTDVTHPFTDFAETDTYGYMEKSEAAAGGLQIVGLKDSGGAAGWALTLDGMLGEAADTTKTTAGIGVVTMRARITDAGTGAADVGADGNLFVIRNNATTRYIFDAEGSAHADVEWTTFDEHDDLALLDSLEASFGQFADQHREQLEALRIAHFDDRPGHAMVNWTRLSMLLVGAVRQLSQRQERLERLLPA
jgi:hypothetical protein